jgi:hypothetical protein
VTVTTRPDPVVTAPGHRGRHRRRLRRIGGPLGLVVALVAALTLIVVSPTGRRPAVDTGPIPAARAWPAAQRADVPGSLPDGPAYQPVLFLDARTSVGTAPSPDATALRLVLRAADGTVRELRRLPMDASPRYAGFTVAGDELAWAESVTDAQGRGRTRMWLADLRGGRPPRQLTADTGQVAFFNSQYDMVIADGRLHWVAARPGRDAVTEIRSVPLTGGKVSVRTERGPWALTAWPWLVSASSGQSGPVQLRDLRARKVFDVDVAPTELVTCSPVWCRVLVLSGDGPARIDLVRPDGTDRQRVAGATATASVVDVAVLDRFELLSVTGPDAAPTSSQQLLAYDLTTGRTVDVATGVGMVLCRGGVLWWSTGEDDATVWHTVDLRTL